MLENVKKKIQKIFEVARERKTSFFQEIQFLLKGIEIGEEIMRVLKIVCVMGLVLLIIMLIGKTIQYITNERTEVSEKNQINKKDRIDTDTIHENSSLEEKYSKFVKQVENLISEKNEQKRQDLNEYETKAAESGKNGTNGNDGKNGADGVQGEAGRNGKDGLDGKNGLEGSDGEDGKNGIDGKDGKSAYTQAVEAGYTGSEEEFTRTIISAESRIQIVENGIQSTTDAIHVTNNHLNATNDLLNEHINQMQQKIGTMHENFQNGCNIISAAITAKGVDTPANSTPNTMADHIGRLAEARYKQGYVDGAASVGSADVEYEYHYHDGNEQDGGACFTEAEYHTHDSQNCYGICANRNLEYIDDYYDGNHDHKYIYGCSVCGFEFSSYGSEGDRYSRTHVSASPICGMPENQILGYQCTCGMSDGQIICAKITY